ncbi:hypothetical protein PALI_a2958 [Pseudoalteromonas aliena SW19]|uniref:Uncharacterized protein n=1 Tax=Pseudoalteromonas aliena SW19 TaxID=1314866 RepID=A0ABR9E2R5_9GAMM|nr:hypothetical protein [Pseudoalteromonas aliena SW19]
MEAKSIKLIEIENKKRRAIKSQVKKLGLKNYSGATSSVVNKA